MVMVVVGRGRWVSPAHKRAVILFAERLLELFGRQIVVRLVRTRSLVIVYQQV